MEEIQNNVDKISIPKLGPKPQQVSDSYDSLLRRLKRKKLLPKIGGIIISIAMVFGAAVIMILGSKHDIITQVVAGLALAGMFAGFYFIEKGNKRIFTKRQQIFFSFYRAYECLRTYTGIESDNMKKEKKNVMIAISRLSNVIQSWTDERSPDCISSLPNSISGKMNHGLLPLIQQDNSNEMNKIKLFRDYLYDFAIKVYDKDPTTEELLDLDKQLTTFGDLPEADVKEKESPDKYSLVKSFIIGVICGFGLFVILSRSELQWGANLLGSVTACLAITGIIEAHKRKKIRSEISNLQKI